MSIASYLSQLLNSSGLVPLSKLVTTGTPSSSNYLRGDGSWSTAGAGVPVVRYYASGATWTKPAGLVALVIEVWGASGSGAVARNVNGGYAAASGGGGGPYSKKVVAAASLGATETVTIGTGGTAVTRSTDGGTNGNAGGTTSFGSLLSVTGGAAGVAYYSGAGMGTAASAAAGTSTGHDFTIAGSASAATSTVVCGQGIGGGGSSGGFAIYISGRVIGTGGQGSAATSIAGTQGIIIVTEIY